MVRDGFLSATDRQALIGIARDGLEEHRAGRRANAIVLLDQDWSCGRVAAALLRRHRSQTGIEPLSEAGSKG